MQVLNDALSLVGTVVVAGGGLSLIVYQLFRHFGAKWLDERFESRLQALKHAQATELEQLRFNMNKLIDRAVKLHQREFEVLPEAWRLLNEAFWATKALIAPFRQYADLDRMTSAHLDEFLAECKLMNWEKEEIRRTDGKTAFYAKRIRWHEQGEMEQKAREAYRHLMSYGVFIETDLRKRFHDLHDLIWNAIVEHGLSLQDRHAPAPHDEQTKLSTNGEALLKHIEQAVHQRLWSGHEAPL